MVSLSNIILTIWGSGAKHFSPYEFFMCRFYLNIWHLKIETTTFHISFVKKCADYRSQNVKRKEFKPKIFCLFTNLQANSSSSGGKWAFQTFALKIWKETSPERQKWITTR